jgi:rhomboid family GlyGly-CTERM serine protease
MKLDFRITAALAVTAIVATATRPDVALADHRIFDGEVWRAVTGSFVHATWGHLVRDLALVAFLGIVYEAPLGRRRFTLLVLAGLILPTLATLAFTPSTYYTGLSGLSHALFGAAIAHELVHRRGRARLLVIAIGLVLLPKIVYELATGAPAFPMDLGSGVRQVPLAHAIGVATGLAAVVVAGSIASWPARQSPAT